ncbi:MAG: hypothetical protein SFU86_05685 [Pirellulaceae bacterium]|nr:hypothetical protein [Pirellulaceae bacterium]
MVAAKGFPPMTDVLTELPDEAGAWQRRRSVPGWIFSFGLHFAVFVTLGLTIRSTPRGAGELATREGGIVLVHRAAGKAQYFSDEAGSDAPASAAAAKANPAAFAPESFQPAQLPGPQLPTGPGPLVGAMPGQGVPGATGLTGSGTGNKGGPLGRGHDYGVETKVFGVPGRGSKFVYVFDRSASMNGYEGRPLSAAKRELIASLQSLQNVHQFQIIFYNENPQLMELFRGQTPGLVFGDEPGKKLAERFIGGVFADGGTAHMKALSLALRMNPDVIFFLTDADEPKLRRDELDRIRTLNRGTTINAIEFGAGPSSGARNFLTQLAAENGGGHAYVDVTRLPR